jgi:hypothetical protein
MKIKIFIRVLRQGRLQMPTREYEKETAHGAMSCKFGILMDDPTYIDDESKRAIEVVHEFSEENNLRYNIYNVANDWPAFCAWVSGIREFPTVTVGGRKITGIPETEELYRALR